MSPFVQQQTRHLGVALLGRQVEGADALLGQGVCLRSVLQQGRGDSRLVLFGRDVKRRVPVLGGGGREVNSFKLHIEKKPPKKPHQLQEPSSDLRSRVGRRSILQQQQGYVLVVVVSCHVERS